VRTALQYALTNSTLMIPLQYIICTGRLLTALHVTVPVTGFV